MLGLFIAITVGLLLVGSGIYAIFKGKIPEGVFGDKGYKTEGTGARVIGAILLIPVLLMILYQVYPTRLRASWLESAHPN